MLEVNECQDGNWEIKRSKLGKQRDVRTWENKGILHFIKYILPADYPWTRQRKCCYIAKLSSMFFATSLTIYIRRSRCKSLFQMSHEAPILVNVLITCFQWWALRLLLNNQCMCCIWRSTFPSILECFFSGWAYIYLYLNI